MDHRHLRVHRRPGRRYTGCDPAGCHPLTDDYIGGLIPLVVAAMIVNTLRFRYDRGKYGRLNDPVTRSARSALALIISAVIVVQAARYLEGVTGEVVVLGVFLTCDYLVINWLRSAERGKQAARSELSTYNYVPHAERRTW